MIYNEVTGVTLTGSMLIDVSLILQIRTCKMVTCLEKQWWGCKTLSSKSQEMSVRSHHWQIYCDMRQYTHGINYILRVSARLQLQTVCQAGTPIHSVFFFFHKQPVASRAIRTTEQRLNAPSCPSVVGSQVKSSSWWKGRTSAPKGTLQDWREDERVTTSLDRTRKMKDFPAKARD